MNVELLVEAYKKMLLIRSFEELIGRLYRDAEIPGFVHTSIGQEACAVGVCIALDEKDVLTSTHRGHGHCLARGMSPDRMLAELYGKADGYCRGRGGSMHVADPDIGVFGANGIVGAGLPIAVGAGLAAKRRQEGISVAFFGEGATATGAFHEALTLASLWTLPVLFVCENNSYVEFSHWSRLSTVSSVTEFSHSYNIEARSVDASDVTNVFATVEPMAQRARSGEGPFLIELTTFRYRGHYEGDAQKYRNDLDRFEDLDPIAKARHQLAAGGVTENELDRLEDEVNAEIERASSFALDSPYPDPEDVLDYV